MKRKQGMEDVERIAFEKEQCYNLQIREAKGDEKRYSSASRRFEVNE